MSIDELENYWLDEACKRQIPLTPAQILKIEVKELAASLKRRSASILLGPAHPEYDKWVTRKPR